MNPEPQQTAMTAAPAESRLLYVHVIVVSLVGGFGVLAWFVVYEWLNKLIWDNAFVAGTKSRRPGPKTRRTHRRNPPGDSRP